MSIPRGFRFFQVLLVILVSLVSLTTFSSQGYCDYWVYVSKDDIFTTYYNRSSVEIDKQKKIIKVRIKHEFTEKGKIELLKDLGDVQKQKYIDINYSVVLFSFNYKERKYSFTHSVFYSKLGGILRRETYPPEWDNIIPESNNEYLLNKILKDYNIIR